MHFLAPYRLLWVALYLLVCASCDYIEYHPYDTRIRGERGLTEVHIAQIEEQMAQRESFCFAVISDTQGCYEESDDLVRQLNSDPTLDFVIHCGDLSDFGLHREFELQRDILQGLRVPYVALIGNHDCIGTGRTSYGVIYGKENFAFTAGNTRFICLNTNAMEFDYSTPVPDFDFLTAELDNLSPTIERVVYAMHVRPGEFQFNNNVKALFQGQLKRAPGLPFCLYGHEHTLRTDDLFGDGILYYQCPDVKKRCYLRFTMDETDYTYEAIHY